MVNKKNKRFKNFDDKFVEVVMKTLKRQEQVQQDDSDENDTHTKQEELLEEEVGDHCKKPNQQGEGVMPKPVEVTIAAKTQITPAQAKNR